MPLTQRLLPIVLILLLVSLACSGAGSDPGDPATSLPPTPAPATATSPPPDPTEPPISAGPTQPDGLESTSVAQVIDGDTIELADGRRVRYVGINTPERNQPYYAEATDTNRQLVAGKQIFLEFDVETFDQYGRSLAYIWADGLLVNREIVARGFANAYTVPPNVKYDAEFRAAEQAARNAERGLWAGADVALKITDLNANAPGNDNENPNGEWIEVANQGAEPVSMAGYTLKDEANHIYTFADFTLPSGAAFRLYSGQGADSATDLYWGYSGDSVWNNGGDTAFLRDAEGRLVDTYAY
jgi:micrococcal nuclease